MTPSPSASSTMARSSSALRIVSPATPSRTPKGRSTSRADSCSSHTSGRSATPTISTGRATSIASRSALCSVSAFGTSSPSTTLRYVTTPNAITKLAQAGSPPPRLPGFADWLRGFGNDVVVGIEGAGSYGAGLCEFLLAEGICVVEVERPRREDRRRGKSDEIDALAAAKKVLAGDGLSTPRAGGSRQALGALLVAYRSCVAERTRMFNQLQALHTSAPLALRERIGPGNGKRLATRVSRMRARRGAPEAEQLILGVLRDYARRARELATQADAYQAELTRQAARQRPPPPQGRGRVRTLQRHRTKASLLRPDDPPPPRPRRRPPSQQRHPHDRAQPLDLRQAHARLPRAPHQRGQDETRSHAGAQTTPLSQPLQAARHHPLDFIEASACNRQRLR